MSKQKFKCLSEMNVYLAGLADEVRSVEGDVHHSLLLDAIVAIGRAVDGIDQRLRAIELNNAYRGQNTTY